MFIGSLSSISVSILSTVNLFTSSQGILVTSFLYIIHHQEVLHEFFLLFRG